GLLGWFQLLLRRLLRFGHLLGCFGRRLRHLLVLRRRLLDLGVRLLHGLLLLLDGFLHRLLGLADRLLALRDRFLDRPVDLGELLLFRLLGFLDLRLGVVGVAVLLGIGGLRPGALARLRLLPRLVQHLVGGLHRFAPRLGLCLVDSFFLRPFHGLFRRRVVGGSLFNPVPYHVHVKLPDDRGYSIHRLGGAGDDDGVGPLVGRRFHSRHGDQRRQHGRLRPAQVEHARFCVRRFGGRSAAVLPHLHQRLH